MQDDLTNLCLDFFERRANLKRLNWVSIVLIDKQDAIENVLDFRPISLINSTCKIIFKLLANRLSRVINDLVDDFQYVFIKGRCIVDNLIAPQALVFNLEKSKLLGLVLRLISQKLLTLLTIISSWRF